MNKILQKILRALSIVLLPICGGVVGALGGADKSSKLYRRVLLPFMLAGYTWSRLGSIWVFTIMALAVCFSLGYGIPDSTDEGSALGRLAYKITKGRHFWADILVRGFIGFLVSLSLISIPLVLMFWIPYMVLSLIIIGIYTTISWRNLGTYKLFGKDLLWSETIVYSTISLAVVVLTYWRK